MKGGADFLGDMRWGVRRYAWLVVAFVVALGVLVPFMQSRGPAMSEARAEVGPTQPIVLQSLDALPRVGDSVFIDGAVAAAVRDRLHLPATASVIPRYVELVAEHNNVVFTVLGHSTNASTAQDLANLAATMFAGELDRYSQAVGPFQVQDAAPLPAVPLAKLGGGVLPISSGLAIVIGLASGLLAGLGATMLLLVLRRPIHDADSAEEAANAPVYGQVRLTGKGQLGEPRYAGDLQSLSHHVLANRHDTILLVSAGRSAQLGLFATAMRNALTRVGEPARQGHGEVQAQSIAVASAGWVGDDILGPKVMTTTGGIHLQVATETSLEHAAIRPDQTLILMVVPEGIRFKALRVAAGECFSGGDGAVVLVSRTRSFRSARASGRTGATSPPLP